MEQPRRLSAALVALIVSAGAAAHEAPAPRLIAVAGQGEVRAVPDRADIGLTVEASERALKDAEGGVSAGVEKVLALCDALGIARKQVRSAQLSVQPQYEAGGVLPGGRPRIVGYVVSREVRVDLRDLGKLGPLMQGALEAGANRVSGPVFDSSRREDLQRQALAAAAEDARANAQILARTLGVKLGRLHSLRASDAGPPMRPMMSAMALRRGVEPEQTYEAGEMAFPARVDAEFELAP